MKKIKNLIPKYAYLPLSVTVVLNFLAYYGTRPLSRGWYHYDLSLPLDDLIPFVPAAISVYVFAFITWVVGYIVITREEEPLCCRILTAEQMAKLVCVLCFLALPTIMERPEITGNDLFSRFTAFIYAADTPDNLFPSVHCLENWILFRGALRCKRVGRGYKVFMGVAAIAVFLSTLLVKQHLILDVVSAVVLVEVALWVAGRLKAERLYTRLNRRLGLA